MKEDQKLAWKVVLKFSDGSLRSVIGLNGYRANYSNLNVPVKAPSINEPFLVFETRKDARDFIDRENGSPSSHECLRIFRVSYVPSFLSQYRNILNYEDKYGWPNGTLFADEVTLLYKA